MSSSDGDRTDLSRDGSDLPPQVEEELLLLDQVLETIRRPPTWRRTDHYVADYLKLRDSLEEERLPEDRASILEQMERISRLAAHRARWKGESVDVNSPYFGHMRLHTQNGERRDVFVGKRTFIRDGVAIVDWRQAPISKVFYQSEEGDDYELEIDGRMLAGVVDVRRTLTIRSSELRRVSTPDKTFVKGREGWVDLSDRQPQLGGGQGRAARPDRTRPVMGIKGVVPSLDRDRRERIDKHLPEIASLLDPAQFQLITRPDSGLICVQGSAGSGKTTVALHRVAFLAFEDPRRFSPKRCLVVVFSRGLARYISKVLPALGVEGVPVKTYQRWSHDQRRRQYPRLPSRYSQYTPAEVTRLKNHTGLLRVLEDFAESHPEADVIEAFDEVFTNKKLLADGFAQHAPGAFSASEIESVHRWCTRQVFDRYDREGERGPDAPTLDDEDNTILLRLHQLLRGPLKRGKRRLSYNHLVVDEVQDLSPIELAVLLDTVKPGNPITLAGDLAQKIVEESDFRDWTEALAAVGRADATLSPLRVSYRSTAPIMQVAHQVLGPLAEGDQPAQAARPGAPVELFQFADAGEAMTFLADVLRELVDSEPTASVAVLARHPEQAEATYQALRRAALPSLQRVRDQDFSFAPGIEVTEISQVKGLEFDYVVLVDCDQATYPATSVSRHLLHVGITRAAHQCWLLSAGPPSRVLPPEIESEI